MITREGGAWEAAMALNGRGAYDTTGKQRFLLGRAAATLMRERH